jgi:hypothetical protein
VSSLESWRTFGSRHISGPGPAVPVPGRPRWEAL